MKVRAVPKRSENMGKGERDARTRAPDVKTLFSPGEIPPTPPDVNA